MTTHTYVLEQLYKDQAYDWVVDTVPAVLAWVPRQVKRRQEPPFEFAVEHTQDSKGPTEAVSISLSWNVAELQKHEGVVLERAGRMEKGLTAQREHVTELAAYGLALVAISVLMPGRRVIHMRKGQCPDLLFDDNPYALRGVEVAGRSEGGMRVLRQVRNGARSELGKEKQLLALPQVAEAHLSLWCASPRVAIMAKVKP